MGGTKCLLSPTPKNMGGTCPPVPHPNKAHDDHIFHLAQCFAPGEVVHSLFTLKTYCDFAMSILKLQYLFFMSLEFDLCEGGFSHKGCYKNESEVLTAFFGQFPVSKDLA